MIIRTLDAARDSERHVHAETWDSVRLLLAGDGMGFSFHITTIKPGTATRMHYQHHLEAVYCLTGNGQIESLDDGSVNPISPGTLYALDKHDRHVLRASTELVLACVFNPPVEGREVHDASGAYPAAGWARS